MRPDGRRVFASLQQQTIPEFPEQVAAVLEHLARELRAWEGDLAHVTLTARPAGPFFVITASAPLEVTS